MLWSCTAGAEENYPIAIDSVKERGGATLWARNEGPAPVSVMVRLTEADNASLDVPQPIITVIPARQRIRLGRITPISASRDWRYAYSWTWLVGSYEARHDPNAVYRVPWLDGRTFRIGQAPGGPITTHTTPWSREAIDVSMPEGTPIVAARAGIVVRIAEGFSESGTSERLTTQANLVSVLHDDGTMADYVHLMKDGVAVRVGEKVAAGKLLGYAGSTGYSTGPHLHFAVVRLARTGESFDYVSVPFSFYTQRPPRVFAPATGMAVRAEYH